ncbi:MAG: CsgG/HfaB family protein [Armatimonadota bacterium]|nr:CsgG/HfaB family protein [Armatimonadota bacterium]MDR7520579.1 CsgG/HfaB family protein [Armatimonadota bacterium]MDR7549713.1 CsgG/HfaB family protein [Armatimonadota bacterium]
MQVRVIVAATGRIVASEAATASAADVGESVAAKEALSKAADLVVDAILPRIAALQAPPAPPVAQPAPGAQPPAAQPAPAMTPAAPAPQPPVPAPDASPAQPDRLRIAILPFQLGFTSPSWAQRWDISLGVTEIVEESLFRTGRYRVIERRALDAVLREQGIGRTGTVDQATAARLGRVLGVQALIAGTVNQFELKAAGGVALPVVAVALYQAQVQLTARVIDTTTGEIIGIARGTGKAEGTMALAVFQNVAFGGAEFSKTVLGRALDQAVEDLVMKLGQTLHR